jgi:uncharacterized protein (DUF1810 family)
MFDLDRFKQAQDRGGYQLALGEMHAGRKQSHWIWYVFPQLSGLGSSLPAIRFGLDGVEEATAYLQDPVLRGRLLAVTEAAASHLAGPSPLPLVVLMGSGVDVSKLVSSMTLFAEVARRCHAVEPLAALERLAAGAEVILAAARVQGHAACAVTQATLAG